MLNLLAQGGTLAFYEGAGEHAPDRRVRPSTLTTAWVRQIGVWIDRHRQRRALGEMARRNDELLRDIGVSHKEALREAAKPFWKR